MDAKPEIWSVEMLVRSWTPHLGWKAQFAKPFVQVTRGTSSERWEGWREAAIIFGDMHACELCLFVCYYCQSLLPGDRSFQPHIDLCLMDMGLATVTKPGAGGTIPLKDLGTPGAVTHDTLTVSAWLEQELHHFGGDLAQAAQFAMRLAAARLGLISGPPHPILAELLDPALWRFVE